MVKAMGNWGLDTHFAWVELLSVSEPQPIMNVLGVNTTERLRRLGMGGSDVQTYINLWCGGDKEQYVSHINFKIHEI